MPARYIIMSKLPQCQFCEEVARYDFRTKSGQWAYGCDKHYLLHRMHENLGIGQGQLLIRESDIRTYIHRSQDKQLNTLAKEGE